MHGERRFLGALDILSSKPVSRTAVVIRAGEVLQLTTDQLQTVLSTDVELRELVLRAYLALGDRLRAQRGPAHPRPAGSSDIRRIQEYADARQLTTDVVDLDANGDGAGSWRNWARRRPTCPLSSPAPACLQNPREAQLDQASGPGDGASRRITEYDLQHAHSCHVFAFGRPRRAERHRRTYAACGVARHPRP